MQQEIKLKRYFFLGIILLIGGLLVASLAEFLTAFLAAIMFYVLSKHPVEWLVRRKGWSKNAAAILTIVVSFFIILLPLSMVVAMLYKKVLLFSQDTSLLLEPLKQLDVELQERFHFVLLSEKNMGKAQIWLTDFLASLLNQGFNLVSSIAMMYFFLYYMIVNINRMEAAIILYLPFEKSKIELFGHELKAQTFSNAVGIPLIAVVQGFLAYVAFYTTNVPQALFWAVLTGLASLLPIIGTGLVWIPVGLYLIGNGGTWQGIGVILWGFLFLGLADNVIRFLLAKRMADVHPIVTVLGVIMGLKYFGITGLIFGPLIISYFLILLRIYYSEYQNKTPLRQRRKKTVPTPFKLPFIN